MYTYQDMLEAKDLMEFCQSAVNDARNSYDYRFAQIATEYFKGNNVTLTEFFKIVYNANGIAERRIDPKRVYSNFFHIFVMQAVTYSLANGINFNNQSTRDKLGRNFDTQMSKALLNGLVEKMSFLFWNCDHVEIFHMIHGNEVFVPLFDEENGKMRAGIRCWQIANTKPQYFTLYAEDGIREFKIEKGNKREWINAVPTPYRCVKSGDKASFENDTYDVSYKNYSRLPIVPFYPLSVAQSFLTVLRSGIDSYDLIKSGLADDIQNCAEVFWSIENAGGMTKENIQTMLDSLNMLKFVNLPNADEGARAVPHQVKIPYEAREVALSRIEKDLYRDAMALNSDSISGGEITATQIQAAYEKMHSRADDIEANLHQAILEILDIAGIDDSPFFVRSRITNRMEEVSTILACQNYLDKTTTVKLLATTLGLIDQIPTILDGLDKEESLLTENALQVEDTDVEQTEENSV